MKQGFSFLIFGLLIASPAFAQIDISVGGHTRNYVGWLDQDEAPGAGNDVASFDMLRESEIYINAEGKADNGLTYGFHLETEMDAGDDANTVDESYIYFSSSLGKINIGSEDGAQEMLQVAAPSADSNVDGMEMQVHPVNYDAIAPAGALRTYLQVFSTTFDYENNATGKTEKITYITPQWEGLQVAASWTPSMRDAGSLNGLAGFNRENQSGFQDQAYEVGARYERSFNGIGLTTGAGYTHIEGNRSGAFTSDYHEWNVGLDLDIGDFGIGAVYTQDENRSVEDSEDQKIVLGVDYTVGDYKFGASYHNRQDNNRNQFPGTGDVETDRYTVGLTYTMVKGLTFRGTLNHIEHDVTLAGQSDVSATYALGGIQLNF